MFTWEVLEGGFGIAQSKEAAGVVEIEGQYILIVIVQTRGSTLRQARVGCLHHEAQGRL